MSESCAEVRLDKWLWAARFFKKRALASAAIKSGKVQLNDERAKPSKNVRAGAQLRIRTGEVLFEVTVVALSDRRGPATVAQQLYQESEEHKARRALEAEQRRQHAILQASQPGRPTKKQRRAIIRFTRTP